MVVLVFRCPLCFFTVFQFFSELQGYFEVSKISSGMSSQEWGRDLARFSSFSFLVAASFFAEKNWTTKQQQRGYNFFVEGFIHNVLTSDLSVKARCYRSQRKNAVPHTMCINFEESNTSLTIKDAHCTCDAGNSESCNHLVGLAYYLNDCILRGNKEIPEDASCTSQAMTWNQPRGLKISPQQVADVVFYKPHKVIRKRPPVMSTLFVPMRTQKLKCVQDEDIKKLKSTISAEHSRISMSYLLSSNIECSPQINVFEDFNVSEDSILGQHSYANSRPEPRVLNNLKLDITVPLRDSKLENILISEPPEPFIKSKDLSNIPQVQHGIQNEEPAKGRYLSEFPHIKYFECGLIIHPFSQHLGASPDGVIYSDSDGYGVLEVKCPNSKKFNNLAGAVKLKTFCLKSTENGFMLKRDCEYFYQVQGQMLLLGVRWAHFVVFLTTSNEIHIEKIDIDLKFCQEMYSMLTNTYRSTIVPYEL